MVGRELWSVGPASLRPCTFDTTQMLHHFPLASQRFQLPSSWEEGLPIDHWLLVPNERYEVKGSFRLKSPRSSDL